MAKAMTSCRSVGRPLLRCVRQSGPARAPCSVPIGSRTFSQTVHRSDEVVEPVAGRPAPTPGEIRAERWKRQKLDPNTTTLHWAERKLMKTGTPPVGSRRRRAAVRTSQNLPFEQLPYQCFQEARQVLRQDRDEKLRQIVAETEKIRRLEASDPGQFRGGEGYKQKKIASLRRYVEELKILADINDPLVKRKFEDGMGDMNKPVYRYLANRRWRALDRKIIQQRIEQFHIVPDVLPKFEPTMEVNLFFRAVRVKPGEILDSRVTEVPPRLRMQAFDKGDRLISVVVMDSDVPVPEDDAFARRCHFLAANIPWSPVHTSLPLSKVDPESQLAVPWLPAFSQKGAPYHRLSVFVLEQKPGEKLDLEGLKKLYSARDGFSLKSFRDKFGLTPVGFNIFRTVWDDGTAAVMERHGLPGADIEFKPRRYESLKPPRKARGWEAKRQKPKYRSLWKYTKRIR